MIEIFHHSLDPLQIDLNNLLEEGKVVVSGSESYDKFKFTPKEALNDKQG